LPSLEAMKEFVGHYEEVSSSGDDVVAALRSQYLLVAQKSKGMLFRVSIPEVERLKECIADTEVRSICSCSNSVATGTELIVLK